MKNHRQLTYGIIFILSMYNFLITIPAVSADESATEGTWKKMASMPTARCVIGVAVVDGKIYAIGGSDANVLGTNEMYDPKTNTWTTKTSIPKVASDAPAEGYDDVTAVACEGKIYCFSWGLNQAYDPATDTWTQKTPDQLNTTYAGATVVDGKIYVIVGINMPSSNTIVKSYDPQTDTWTTIATLPFQAIYCTTTVIDNKIYLMCVTGGAETQQVQIYDPKTNTWSVTASSPTYPTFYQTITSTTGTHATKKLYLIGGNVYPTLATATTRMNIIQLFDVKTNTWTTEPGPPTARKAISVAVVDDRIYTIGGYTSPGSVYSSVVERYTPAEYSDTPLQTPTLNPTPENTEIPWGFTLAGILVAACVVTAVSLLFIHKKKQTKTTKT
jgi:N-acetylneuraminic acid mutarotase